MEFYQTINSYYDHIFPLNRMQVEFVKGMIPAGRVLDVGCATGSLAIALSEIGYEVSAIDLDEGMIELARLKPNHTKVGFSAGDMLSISGMYSQDSFEGISCFGNTLVHLSNAGEIGEFFRSANLLLKSGGKLLLQVLNYDQILRNKIESLPLIENETIRFERYYEHHSEGSIKFRTTLTIKASQSIIDNTVILYPVTKKEIADLLSENGYIDVAFFGGFNKSRLEESSLPLVAIATKP